MPIKTTVRNGEITMSYVENEMNGTQKVQVTFIVILLIVGVVWAIVFGVLRGKAIDEQSKATCVAESDGTAMSVWACGYEPRDPR